MYTRASQESLAPWPINLRHETGSRQPEASKASSRQSSQHTWTALGTYSYDHIYTKHICTYTYIKHAYKYLHTYTYTNEQTYIDIHMYICTDVAIYIVHYTLKSIMHILYIYITDIAYFRYYILHILQYRIRIYIHIYIYLYIHIYIQIYIYIHIHTYISYIYASIHMHTGTYINI